MSASSPRRADRRRHTRRRRVRRPRRLLIHGEGDVTRALGWLLGISAGYGAVVVVVVRPGPKPPAGSRTLHVWYAVLVWSSVVRVVPAAGGPVAIVTPWSAMQLVNAVSACWRCCCCWMSAAGIWPLQVL